MLCFNAFAFCLFGLPHIFSEDGNLTEMGFSWTTDFMPRSRSMAEAPLLADQRPLQMLTRHLEQRPDQTCSGEQRPDQRPL